MRALQIRENSEMTEETVLKEVICKCLLCDEKYDISNDSQARYHFMKFCLMKKMGIKRLEKVRKDVKR